MMPARIKFYRKAMKGLSSSGYQADEKGTQEYIDTFCCADAQRHTVSMRKGGAKTHIKDVIKRGIKYRYSEGRSYFS